MLRDLLLVLLAGGLGGSVAYALVIRRQLRTERRERLARDHELRDAEYQEADRLLNRPTPTRPPDGRPDGKRRGHLRVIKAALPIATVSVLVREHPRPLVLLAGMVAALAVAVTVWVTDTPPSTPGLAKPNERFVPPPRTVEPGEPLDPDGPASPPNPPTTADAPRTPAPPAEEAPVAAPLETSPPESGRPVAAPPVEPTKPPVGPEPPECRVELRVLDVLDLCVPDLPAPPDLRALGGQPQPVLVGRPSG